MYQGLEDVVRIIAGLGRVWLDGWALSLGKANTEGVAFMATHEAALADKRERMAAQPAIVQTWHTAVLPTPEDAVDFLNEPPAQVAGQAFASNRADGQVDVYYFL